MVRVHRPGRLEGPGLGGSRGGGIARHRRIRGYAAAEEADRADRRLRIQRLMRNTTQQLLA